MTSNLTRLAPFDDASSTKRRKLTYDSENDSGEELFAGYTDSFPDTGNLLSGGGIPTQPLNNTSLPLNNFTYSSVPTQPLLPTSSPPQSSFATQATQVLHRATPTQHSTPQHPPVVQVPRSSPYRQPESSPLAPPRPMQSKSAVLPDNSIRPFDFYSRPAAKPINLDSDGPQYIGSSSEGETSDHGIKPIFSKDFMKQRRLPPVSSIRHREGNPTPQENRVPQSPMSMSNFAGNLAARFAYDSAKKPVGRLDSLQRRPGISLAGGGGPFQRRPEPAVPTVDITLEAISNSEHKETVRRMKAVCPSKRIDFLLNALIRNNGNFDTTMDELVNQDNPVDLTGDDNGRPSLKTANRGTGAGKVAIKDKWSSTQAVRRNLASSPPASAPNRKRKLVKSSNRTSRERSESPPAPITIDDSDDSAIEEDENSEDERELEENVLKYINSCDVKGLSDFACTTEEVADVIISHRPFSNLDAVREVSTTSGAYGKKRRGGRSKPVGDKVVDVCLETWRGYDAVDSLIQKVEQLGKPLAECMKSWGVDVQTGGELEMTDISIESDSVSAKDSGIGTPTDDGEVEIKGSKRAKQPGAFKEQPKNMREGVVLKDYQLAGLNWLNLLYEKNLSCILADEMGLGKTCQVIAFFAHLLLKGVTGPHLVVVPSSTLENWLREFANFCPELKVEPYYGLQKERPLIREALRKDRSWNVLVTTYQLATGDKNDRGFLKSLRFNCCVYDEGHLLKNGSSNRYDALIKLPADFRLLLTGTPLQNNLQELASLLAFILPSIFDEKKADLASIFKYKAKTTDDDEANNALLSRQRIKRARAMMTPFVLRRKKAQVLKHLPSKTNRVEYCILNKPQSMIYHDQIASAKEAIVARAEGKKPTNSTSNVMMQLRKAAIHPLLFRNNYPDDKLNKMARDIMKEPQYKDNEHQAIFEDMEVMNDLELSRLCLSFPKTIGKYALKKQEWMDSGKVDAFKRLLMDMRSNGDRVLVFSQFTQVLDILELVLTTMDMGYLRIDGSTPVEARQDLIDQYHAEEDIMVFLLSTKAGGFGINLACANKVVIFDSSFNPHDDAQASDRAHRVGQTREVEIVRLVTKNTIEEQILQLANTKLALDQSVSEGDGKAMEGKGEELVAKMLLQSKDPSIAT